MISNRMTHELSLPTIPVRYLAEMCARSGATQSAIARALGEASLPPSALRHSGLRVSVIQLERFYRALRRETGDEMFGYFERPVPPGSYATIVRLMTSCGDIASALDASFRFYRLFDHQHYWRVEEAAGRVTVTIDPRDADQRASIYFSHIMLISPWRTAAWLSARPVAVLEVRLQPRFRRFASETRYLFGCEPTFARGNPAIVLPADLLRYRVVREPAQADEYVATSLRHHVLAPEQTTLESELRALLSAAKPFADLGLPEVARRLGMSRASLARKLADQGLSFQRLKDELRRDQAIALLTNGSRSIADIAELLGYSAPSAFQRAFRDWTGLPPGRLRKR
jgi:AraC-like DNA-binding protein